jgi:hypothetical protein
MPIDRTAVGTRDTSLQFSNALLFISGSLLARLFSTSRRSDLPSINCWCSAGCVAAGVDCASLHSYTPQPSMSRMTDEIRGLRSMILCRSAIISSRVDSFVGALARQMSMPHSMSASSASRRVQ